MVKLYRLFLVAFCSVFSCCAVLVTLPFPVRIRNIKLGSWVGHYCAKMTLWLLRVKFEVTGFEHLRHHSGLLFPNHLSHADAVLLMGVFPIRFMSNHEVKKIPFLGWLAWGVDTIMVDRSKLKSRAEAQAQTLAALRNNPYPAIAVFPEGKIGNEDQMISFKLGAFKMAQDAGVGYLPIVIHYTPLHYIRWYSDTETMIQSIMRFAGYGGKTYTTVQILPPVYPNATTDIRAQMKQTWEEMQILVGDYKVLDAGVKK